MIIEDDEGNTLNSRDLDAMPTSGSYRLVVCVDVTADNLTEAYRKVRRFISEGPSENALGWETSDEWYGPDGEQGDEAELQAAIMKAIELDKAAKAELDELLKEAD